MANIYQVGGCVRDSILGRPCKDIDYACEFPSFADMVAHIEANGGTIYMKKPEFAVVRARFAGVDADFVLCRKDGAYTDGRRPDSVETGTLRDDLARRDFTMNAMARDLSGAVIDPFGGLKDIQNGVIACVGDTASRLSEDSLRMLRAIRFSITLGMTMSEEIKTFITEFGDEIKRVSVERVREELLKCFAANTMKTLKLLSEFPKLSETVFGEMGLNLMPTCKNF